MSKRIIITIDDDSLSVGNAIKLLDLIDYDKHNWDKDCLWKLSDGHYINVDDTKLKTGIKINIWKEEE